MAELTFSIPWDELASKNAKFVGKFGKVLAPDYRDAMEKIGNAAFLAAKKSKWKRTDKRCGVEIVITEPDHRVRDAYNYGECVLDGMSKMSNDAIWWDDCQARDVRCRMVEGDKEHAGAVVRVWTL